MFDIIHHLYQGDVNQFIADISSSSPKDSNRSSIPTYRILLAEYFHPDVIYHLMDFVRSRPIFHFEITLITENVHLVRMILEWPQSCVSLERFSHITIKPIALTLTNFIKYHKQSHLDEQETYHYIEYFDGISLSATEDRDLHLSYIPRLLHPNIGIVGCSFLSRNIHTEKLHQLVSSYESPDTPDGARRYYKQQSNLLIENYLEFYHLDRILSDQFMDLFPSQDRKDRSDSGRKGLGTIYSIHEIPSLFSQHGLYPKSWLSMAWSHPYGKTPFYEIQ